MLLDEFDKMEKRDYAFICFRRELLEETLQNAAASIPKLIPDWGEYDRTPLMSRILDHVRTAFDKQYSIDLPREFRIGLVEHPEYDTEKLENEREHYTKTLVYEYIRTTIRVIQMMISDEKEPEEIARLCCVPVSSVLALSQQMSVDENESGIIDEDADGEHSDIDFDEYPLAMDYINSFKEGYINEGKRFAATIPAKLVQDGKMTPEEAEAFRQEILEVDEEALHKMAVDAFHRWRAKKEQE